MLAVVKMPHTDITVSGKDVSKVVELLRQHFPAKVVYSDDFSYNENVSAEEELVVLEDSDWWQENKHRVLAGSRHKAGITQKELAEKSGIKQSVISDYERGKRPITLKAAIRLAEALGVDSEDLIT